MIVLVSFLIKFLSYKRYWAIFTSLCESTHFRKRNLNFGMWYIQKMLSLTKIQGQVKSMFDSIKLKMGLI